MSVMSPGVQFRELAAGAVSGAERVGGGATPEQALTLAARRGAGGRAGWGPPHIAGRLPVCPADQRPAAGPAPAATLVRLLGDSDAMLIEEWANLALARGVRVDEATAPALLDWWSRQPQRAEVLF